MSKREGPRARFDASCFDCAHERSEHYEVQGDSGCDVYCAHPDVVSNSRLQSRGRIGDTTWTTPDWCPLLVVAVERLVRDRKAGVGRQPDKHATNIPTIAAARFGTTARRAR